MLTRDELNDITYDIWIYGIALRDRARDKDYETMIYFAKEARDRIDDLLKGMADGTETD